MTPAGADQQGSPIDVDPGPFPLPPKSLSPAGVFWYSIASLGCGMFFSFNNFVLPLFLKTYTHDARLLGLMGSSHSVEGAVIQPIVGGLSDRLRSRWGRRRPFMLAFVPLSALFLAITPAMGGMPGSIRLGAIIGAIFLFTVFFNIALDPYRALMPDITPEQQRGRVNSVWSLLGVFGQAAILLIPMPLAIKFAVVAVVMVGTMLLTVCNTREPDAEPSSESIEERGGEWRVALRGLMTLRQAAKGLLVFFLAGLGVGAVLPNLTLFVQSITHCSDHQAEMMPFVLMITTAVAVLPCGVLTDRIGPKRMLLASLAVIAVASLAALKVETLGQVSIVLVLAGLGNAAMSAANYPLMTDIVPSQEVGLYTGLLTTMESIAQPLTVVITGSMINAGSYRVIFGVCSLCMIAALLVLAAIDPRRAKAEIATHVGDSGAAAA